MKDLPDMGLPKSVSPPSAAPAFPSIPRHPLSRLLTTFSRKRSQTGPTTSAPRPDAETETDSTRARRASTDVVNPSSAPPDATGPPRITTLGTVQQRPPLPPPPAAVVRQSWFARWRWVLAALAVIILGRISSS